MVCKISNLLRNYAKNLGASNFGSGQVTIDKKYVKISLPIPVTSFSFKLEKKTRIENLNITFIESN